MILGKSTFYIFCFCLKVVYYNCMKGMVTAVKVSDFLAAMDKIAPFSTAESWDNTGLLIGNINADVTGVVLALDATEGVLQRAASIGANLIITHHPVIFSPVKSVTAGDIVWQAVNSGISIICAHTNLDMACGGVNDTLADLFGIENRRPMLAVNEDEFYPTLGIIGEIDIPLTPHDFACFIKEKLGNGAVRYADGGQNIKTVAVCGGSGADYFADAAAKGIDAFVTGESKHHIMLDAVRLGITYVEAGHFETENPVMKKLAEKLISILPNADITVYEGADIFYA